MKRIKSSRRCYRSMMAPRTFVFTCITNMNITSMKGGMGASKLHGTESCP
jgi:hypothetical protein